MAGSCIHCGDEFQKKVKGYRRQSIASRLKTSETVDNALVNVLKLKPITPLACCLFPHNIEEHWCLHVKFYCSDVTKELLIANSKYTYLKEYIITLSLENPTSITLKDEKQGKDDKLLVTMFAAGHCPGSVMFLFEGSHGNVLYTGDFRLAKGEAKRMHLLHSGSRVKDIKSIYLDTTFCSPDVMHLPSRVECLQALIELVDGWIYQSPKHMVRLTCKAKYGYEYLFVELSKHFNMQIHVSVNHFSYYNKVPDVSQYLTTEGKTTQIHACKWEDCKLEETASVLVIQPSTMWFIYNAKPGVVKKLDTHKYRVCFSFHSSCSEIRDFVGYLCPENVYPNVIPVGCSEEVVVNRSLVLMSPY
uniref:Protein artemis n=1 Tax=Saccoglossus kowalevskii TaxID=10224 RepID=A0ABM0M8P2_SACKO|nr:PREDICTED: protein artemis-like [Saccoglossus kowalevskii]